jgi:hypothetical protein
MVMVMVGWEGMALVVPVVLGLASERATFMDLDLGMGLGLGLGLGLGMDLGMVGLQVGWC